MYTQALPRRQVSWLAGSYAGVPEPAFVGEDTSDPFPPIPPAALQRFHLHPTMVPTRFDGNWEVFFVFYFLLYLCITPILYMTLLLESVSWQVTMESLPPVIHNSITISLCHRGVWSISRVTARAMTASYQIVKVPRAAAAWDAS